METQLQLAFNTDSHGLMASELVEKYATECKNKGYIDEYIGELNVKTIQNRLLELDKGQKLAWWKKHGSFTNFLLQYTGLTRDSLGLNEEPSTFNFNDAPNLPSVNLNVNEYWQIAKPVYDYTLNSANSLNYYNVDIAEINFWITKNERALATGKTQWLCVRDELEYDFLVRRLKANDAFNFVELNNLNEDELKRDDHIEKIFEFTPLAVCILEKIHEFDFLKLLQMRKKQSLFIISKYKSPFLGQLLSSENKNDYNFECSVDCFTWTYVDNWREKFIEWIENRYKSAKKRINFNGLATKNWLLKHDKNFQVFSNAKSVLQFCFILTNGSIDSVGFFNNREPSSLLFKNLSKLNKNLNKKIKKLAEARWNRKDISIEGHLPIKIWSELFSGNFDVDLNENWEIYLTYSEMYKEYEFKYEVLLKLHLIFHLTENLKAKNIQDISNFCFDPGRRDILDNALNACSIDTLMALVPRKPTSIYQTELALSEALFIAIGRRIAWLVFESEFDLNKFTKDIDKDIIKQLVGDVVMKLSFSESLPTPWTRTISNDSQKIDWISACWAWSLRLPCPSALRVPDSWLFPGWSSKLPESLPRWLEARFYFDKDGHHSRINEKDFYRDKVLIRLLKDILKCKNAENLSKNVFHYPVSFKIASLCSIGFDNSFVSEKEWWRGVFLSPWAECILLENLSSLNNKDSMNFVKASWPSFIQHIVELNSEVPSGIINALRENDSKLLQWMLEKINLASLNALELLASDDSCYTSVSINSGALDERLNNNCICFLLSNPEILDFNLKSELLKLIFERPSLVRLTTVDHAFGFFGKFGPEVVNLLVPFLESATFGKGAALAIWYWSPEFAEKILQDERQSGVGVKLPLILYSPVDRIEVSTLILSKDATIRQKLPDIRTWVRARISNAKNHATTLFELLREHESIAAGNFK